jgi:DNA-binding transcriptional regulator YiaG
VTPAQVKKLRKRFNLTQQGLANLLGVPQSTVGRWEAAISSPRGLYRKALRELAEKAKNKKRGR